MASKVMKEAYDKWCKSDIEYLCGENEKCAYNRCSDKKWKAWEYCKKLMDDKVGINMRFIGVNTFVFTCGFVYYKEGGDKMFVYITPSSNRECPVRELEGN